jgi:hypothetical protein
LTNILDDLTLEEAKELLGVSPNLFQLYDKYKHWWISTQAGGYVGTFWGNSAEECFSKHMSTLTLQEFIERLPDFEDYQIETTSV